MNDHAGKQPAMKHMFLFYNKMFLGGRTPGRTHDPCSSDRQEHFHTETARRRAVNGDEASNLLWRQFVVVALCCFVLLCVGEALGAVRIRARSQV